MQRDMFKSRLGLYFIAAVVFPSIILSALAMRSINREKAFIEKSLENTLLAETNHVVSLIQSELSKAESELNQTVPIEYNQTWQHMATQWKKNSSLVFVPFVLSQSKDILWPNRYQDLSQAEMFFLKKSKDFFQDREKTPIYQNIAVAYKNQILDDAQQMEQQQFAAQKIDSVQSVLKAIQCDPQQPACNTWQYAESKLKQYEPIRKKIYQEAKGKGQLQYRKVKVAPKSFKKGKPQNQIQESMFITESLNFSEIISKSESGIIPRIIGDKVHLLFWKKDSEDFITGCLIDQNNLIKRIADSLPNIYSEIRILTILNENGKPLIVPKQGDPRDWSTPFVAKEISELLPHWELAAYLTDPDIITSKAKTTAIVMWILILILFVSITSGGILVLKSLYSEIRLAQQKTTFAANVSHELKTPLTSIRMFTEMLKEKRQPDETKRQQYLDIMLSETERLTRIINNVLDFSKMGQKKRQYVIKTLNVVEVCRDIIEGQRLRLEYNGFVVKFRSESASITIEGDGEVLKQALLNLISNAEKYSNDRKEIDVEIIQEHDTVLINVKDRGVGISSSEAKKIFEEFYRIDDSLTAETRGTGLGLTIAQKIIRDHQGDIIYLPREGGGSIFQIKLPVKKA